MDTVPVEIAGRRYDVLIGIGLLDDLATLVRERVPAAHYAVVSDSHVAALYGRAAVGRLRDSGLAATLASFPAGEWNKSRESWAAVTDELLTAGVGRDGVVLAIGGGVTGDLAGFVAATYLRGVPWAHLPTTLLAMADAAIGGKTGVDTPSGKNLVGAFHQPSLVAADVGALATLSRQQIASGAAEALKHGVVTDAAYFRAVSDAAPAMLERDLHALRTTVTRSAAIKAGIVAADERETGARAILNFGHTIGHAIEATSGYEVLHGEAVAIGMLIEARIAERLGLAENVTAEIEEALLRFGLPVERPEHPAEELLAAMQRDKKARLGAVRFALPTAIGQMATSADGGHTIAVDERVILSALT